MDITKAYNRLMSMDPNQQVNFYDFVRITNFIETSEALDPNTPTETIHTGLVGNRIIQITTFNSGYYTYVKDYHWTGVK
jgi:hypothetical protein